MNYVRKSPDAARRCCSTASCRLTKKRPSTRIWKAVRSAARRWSGNAQLHAAFDQVEIEPPASVLWESRQNLQRQIAAEHAPAHTASGLVGWWDS